MFLMAVCTDPPIKVGTHVCTSTHDNASAQEGRMDQIALHVCVHTLSSQEVVPHYALELGYTWEVNINKLCTLCVQNDNACCQGAPLWALLLMNALAGPGDSNVSQNWADRVVDRPDKL